MRCRVTWVVALALLALATPLFAQSNVVYMEPAHEQSSNTTVCGTSQHPCAGFFTAIAQARTHNASVIMALPGSYDPLGTFPFLPPDVSVDGAIVIDFPLRIQSTEGPDETTILLTQENALLFFINYTNIPEGTTSSFEFSGFSFVSNSHRAQFFRLEGVERALFDNLQFNSTGYRWVIPIEFGQDGQEAGELYLSGCNFTGVEYAIRAWAAAVSLEDLVIVGEPSLENVAERSMMEITVRQSCNITGVTATGPIMRLLFLNETLNCTATLSNFSLTGITAESVRPFIESLASELNVENWAVESVSLSAGLLTGTGNLTMRGVSISSSDIKGTTLCHTGGDAFLGTMTLFNLTSDEEAIIQLDGRDNTLENFTVRNCSLPSVLAVVNRVTANQLNFTNNRLSSGLYQSGVLASLLMTNSVFVNNRPFLPATSFHLLYLRTENGTLINVQFHSNDLMLLFVGNFELQNVTMENQSEKVQVRPEEESIFRVKQSRFVNCQSKHLSSSYVFHQTFFEILGSNVWMEDTTFDGIAFPDAAIFMDISTQLTMTRVTLQNSLCGIFQDGGSLHMESSHVTNISTRNFSPVHSEDGLCTVNNVTFAFCYSRIGGAITFGGTSEFSVTSSFFDRNSAGQAGALLVTEATSGNITDCTFQECHADSVAGAIMLTGNGSVALWGTKVVDCTALSGAGIVYEENSISYLNNVTVANNSADASGGGLLLTDYARLTAVHLSLYGNTAGTTAGGVYATNFVHVDIGESTIEYNVAASDGGGIFVKDGATVNLYHVNITDNASESTGGGINLSGNATGTFTYSVLVRNYAGKGGGMAIHNSAFPTVINCTLLENYAITAAGVILGDISRPRFQGCQFINNNSTSNAGCVLSTDLSGGIFEDCVLSGNNALGGSGGGFLLEDFTQTNITRCSLTNNTAYIGGAVMVTSRFPVQIVDCNMTGNTATLNGGAIAFDEESQTTILGGKCEGNLAISRGGCIIIEGAASPVITTNITTNTAGIAGGGIYASTNVNMEIENCLIRDNRALIGGGLYSEKAVTGHIQNTSIIENWVKGGGGGGGYFQTSLVAFTNVAIQYNNATRGGGLVLEGQGLLMQMTDVIFSYNNASSYGGAIFFANDNFQGPDTLHANTTRSINFKRITFHENTAKFGAAIYLENTNPPNCEDLFFTSNQATKMGAAIYIAEKQRNSAWMYNTTFENNEAGWGGANIAWSYMSNTTVPSVLCDSCLYKTSGTTGYNNAHGFATLPLDIQTEFPPFFYVETNDTAITVYLMDQLGTRLFGNIYEDNTFVINMTYSGCTIDGIDTPDRTIHQDGNATFSGLNVTGKDGTSCEFEFSCVSNGLATSVQNLNRSILVSGCPPNNVVQEGDESDTCVPSGISTLESLLLFAVLLGFLLLWIILILVGGWRRTANYRHLASEQGALIVNMHGPITIDTILKDPTIPDIDWKNIALVKRIGHGASGLVYHAKWKRGRAERDIAVKELKLGVGEMNQKILREFLMEIQIMSALADKHVVHFIGISVPSPHKIYLVTELMQRGSLRNLLDSSAPFPWESRLKFAIDAAQGVEYIHNRGLIHRDLKTSNLLVNDQCLCKIADFGISTVKEDESGHTEDCVGTPVYMAPEVIRNNEYSKAADVYAWGIIMFELYTKEYPYQHSIYARMHIQHLTYQIAHKGVRPDCTRLPLVIRELLQDCWADNPRMRPDFSEIVSRLKRLAKMKDIDPESYVPSTPGTRVPSLDLPDLATDSECDSPLLDLEAAYRSSTGDSSSVYSSWGDDTGSSIQ